MQHARLDQLGNTLASLAAIAMATLAAYLLWLARYQPVEMDLAMMHYCAFLINEKGLLLYRDIFENNLPGPFLFHAIIGQLFGYGALAVRLLDTAFQLALATACWMLLKPVSRSAAVMAAGLFACLYLAGGTVAAFQRDYIAILPIVCALLVVCLHQQAHRRDAGLVGALCGLACGFKPNLAVVAPAFYWLLLQQMPGTYLQRILHTLLPIGCGFVALFSIPFLWALRHGDLAELVRLYQTYTPIYVSTRIDLYHYDNRWQQWHDLLVMQSSHLAKMAVYALPGLLWARRQWRNDKVALHRLHCLGWTTFAISWHEMIAGKYWFAHLLPPYFFTALCFALLLVPAAQSASPAERALRWAGLIAVIYGANLVGHFSYQRLANAHYDADNSGIRSMQIARYLRQHLQPGDNVQALDGSGDGQGSLLLAGATTATRFVEDIPLYLQPDSPVTQGFRREFLDSLAKSPPAYIVYIHNFFHPAGGNRLQEFRELDAFIQERYTPAELVDGEYTIFRRK